MSNVLKVSQQTTIHSLQERGWSQRRIARELGINRETVGRYWKPAAKPAKPTAGSGEAEGSNPANATTGSREEAAAAAESNPAKATAGKGSGRKSQCEPHAERIVEKVEAGLSAQRIYQDLVAETGFEDSYESVKRYVRKLKAGKPERVWRLESRPGEEVQVDFGLGAPVESEPGRWRRNWVLRMVLSYSRKGYSEAVSRQDTESFVRAIENGLRSFGGVPQLLNLDNLKAGVIRADWYDPEINPKLAHFCRHYGLAVMPCRPRTPQHKGKVERGVGYVRNNALKGRRFRSLAEQNQFLAQWESGVADQRIHGTTRQQVSARFEEERPHLQALPASLFECYQEAQRSVHRDGYVELGKSFYAVPTEYISRQVWVRWDSRCVRIYNERLEEVQVHRRLEPGQYSSCLGTGGLSTPVRASCQYWVSRAAVLGEPCGQWAQAAVDGRGPEALRAIMGLCTLIKKHSAVALSRACSKALEGGTHRLKDVRRLLEGSQAEQEPLPFAESHPLIRDLKVYSDFVNDNNKQKQTDNNEENNQNNEQHPTSNQTTSPEAASFRAA